MGVAFRTCTYEGFDLSLYSQSPKPLKPRKLPEALKPQMAPSIRGFEVPFGFRVWSLGFPETPKSLNSVQIIATSATSLGN